MRLLLALASAVAVYAAACDAKYFLEHSLDGSTFVHAATLNDLEGGQQLRRPALSKDEESALKRLIAADGFYRLRLYPRADRSQDSSYLATAVRARCFAAADARDALRVDLDMSTGEPVAIEYVAASPACNADVATAAAAATAPALPPATPVTTKLPVKAAPMKEPGEGGVMLGGAGQAGSGAARQGQPGAGAAAGAGGKGGKGAKDERSWLQKNWLMVLGVGMMIINLVAKLNPPEGAAAGVPAAGGAAGRAAAARR